MWCALGLVVLERVAGRFRACCAAGCRMLCCRGPRPAVLAGGTRERLELCERGGELAGPGPCALQAQVCATAVERESCGCVQQPVAQSLGLGCGELAVE